MKAPNPILPSAGARRIRGQGMTEYIIIVGLIAVAAIVAVSAFGTGVKGQFKTMAQSITGEAPTQQQNLAGAVTQTKAVTDTAVTLKDYAQ